MTKQKPLNLLSIDWDYFINATNSERCLMFPDVPNENYNKIVQNIIWESCYNNPNLAKITTKKELLKKLLFIIKKFNNITLVVDSHKECYYFYNMLKNTNHKINLTNIDFHHDCYGIKKEINCGNWLSHLIKENPSAKFTWLKCNDSTNDFMLNEAAKKLKISTDFNNIMNTQWDAIFICKSEMWSPPHLDNEFLELINNLQKTNCSYIDSQITQPRTLELTKDLL